MIFTTARRHSSRIAALLALSMVTGAAASAQRVFTSLTMFGDSFSDVGNANRLTGAVVPIWLSNGLIWSDVLGSRIGRTTDVRPAFVAARPTGVYAVSGALTGGGPTGTGTQVVSAGWPGQR